MKHTCEITVGRLAGKFRASRWDGDELVLWCEGDTEDDALAALNARMGLAPAEEGTAAALTHSARGASSGDGDVRMVRATVGGLQNQYIRLGKAIDLFEADTIGGSNSESAALRKVTIEWQGQPGFETDIDGVKTFLRNRALVSRFVRDSGLKAGDQVEIRRLASYRYRLTRVPVEGRDAPENSVGG